MASLHNSPFIKISVQVFVCAQHNGLHFFLGLNKTWKVYLFRNFRPQVNEEKTKKGKQYHMHDMVWSSLDYTFIQPFHCVLQLCLSPHHRRFLQQHRQHHKCSKTILCFSVMTYSVTHDLKKFSCVCCIIFNNQGYILFTSWESSSFWNFPSVSMARATCQNSTYHELPYL